MTYFFHQLDNDIALHFMFVLSCYVVTLCLQVGYIMFVDLQRGDVRFEVDVNEHITGLQLIHNDHMTLTVLIVS